MVVAVELLDGNDFVAEASFIPCCCSKLLAAQGEFILRLPAESILAGEIFGGRGHGTAAIRVEQRDHQGIFEFALTEPEPPTGAPNHMRRLTHRFHSAGEDDLRLAKLDQLSR